MDSPAPDNRSPDRALSKQDSDQSTSEGNPLVAKEKNEYRCGSKAEHSVRPRTVDVRKRTETISLLVYETDSSLAPGS